MKNLKLILVFVFALGYINAQEKTVSGTVTSANDGLPIPGANVIIKGTSKGAQTNFDGKYVITVKPEDELVYSFIGYQTITRKVGDAQVINVALLIDSATLDEVVITGYGATTKTRVTRSASVNEAERIQRKQANAKVAQTLSGQVAGVNVTNSNGLPGNATNIRVRGSNSIQGNQSPLYIVDGVPYTGSLDKLKSKDIKSTTVLKDANSTAIYGSRGANGVIIITTTHGSITTDNQDNYAEIHENDFKRANQTPLSTFSIDVDKASYSNIRRMINNGQTVPADAVKIEEMVNYFNYNYSQPKDEHPFSIHTEVVQTPWHNDTQLVRIGLQGKTYANDALPASNLTFLIDVSGSMGGQNKLPLLKSAFKLLVNQLREKDKVSIVVYAGAAGVVLEPTSGDKKDKILAALDQLHSGGSTAGGAGIELAYKLAEKHFKKNGNNRVILATDGDFNVGASSDKAMENLIKDKRKSGVFLSVLGFGYGNYKDSKLETLADKGNGNHAYIDNMQEAQKVFGKEFGGTLFTIAKDVKIQVEFNPKKVQAYRLIGYENRLLADEDFIDDTKDAGELGSGHTVTALYEIVPVGIESDYIKTIPELKYTQTKTTSNYENELFTVKFRYKRAEGSKSIEMVHIQNTEISDPSEDMNFASAVALFGMQLRQSKYFNKAKVSTVIELADKGRGDDKEGYRAEFIRLVKSYENLN
jgi:Ca-activated chloride channel family protein